MTEEIDAVLLDAGGTLIDLSPSRETVISEILSELGMNVEPARISRAIARTDGAFDAEMAELDGSDETEFWNKYDDHMLRDLGFIGDPREFCSLAGKRFGEMIPKVESWVEYPEVRSTLELLRRRDLSLGVVSNATDLVVKVLDNLSLTKYFDAVIWSEAVGVRKPAPKIFHIAAERLGVKPGRCVFAGDKLTVDVIGAKRAGMNAVLIDRAGAYPNANCIRASDLRVFNRFL